MDAAEVSRGQSARAPRSSRAFLWRIGLLGIGLAVYFGVAVWSDWPFGPPARDEVHYWPSALWLTESFRLIPERLRDYPELCTPLWLLISGWFGRLTGLGLPGARVLTFLSSISILLLFVCAARGPAWRVFLSGVGLLVFPYVAGLAVHLYPDSLAVFLTLTGLALYLRRHPWWAAVSFCLAVSTRQYMVAVPIGIMLWRLTSRASLEPIRRSSMSMKATLASDIVVCLPPLVVLAGWCLLWGGFGPPSEVAKQQILTAPLFRVVPQYAIYSLAGVGFYFVVVHWTLLDRRWNVRSWISTRSLMLLAMSIAASVIFTPVGNVDYVPRSMGYLDRMIPIAVGDSMPARIAVFTILGWLGFRLISRWSLGSAIVLAHVLIMAKAHIAWDKYLFPVLACLWFLSADSNGNSREDVEQGAGESRTANLQPGTGQRSAKAIDFAPPGQG